MVYCYSCFGDWCIWRLASFFASAATNNCQAENGINICDVNQTGGGSDTILSVGPEAEALGTQGWGVYYGAAFRAPTAAYKGAVPVHRVYNTQYSWHDWVTDVQKREKEAKYGANVYEGVAFFAWENGNVPGTVPVYRVTRGGGASQSLFSTDKSFIDRLLADGANDPNGWKSGTVLPAIAFYAFPPNYKVAGQANPYDCTILENYVSSRCSGARENLDNAVAAGNVPTTNDCPKTLDVYRKAPFASQFSSDCQKFWNAYMQDCSIQENFLSDRCKTQRDALAAANAQQAQQRAAAAAAASARSGGAGSVSSRPSVNLSTGFGAVNSGSATSPLGATSPSRQGLNVNWGATIAGTARNYGIGTALSAGAAVGNARNTISTAVGLTRTSASVAVNNLKNRSRVAAVNIVFKAANLGTRAASNVIGFLRG